MKLTAENVEKVFMNCLFRDDEIVDGKPVLPPTTAEGITQNFGFHPERLEAERENVRALLMELPKEFQQATGDGWSFLNACMDKEGNHWGEHSNVQEILCLGIALGLASYIMPKEMWSVLPGGMPYFRVSAK